VPGLDRCSRSERSLQPEGALPPMPWSADRCRIRGSSGYIVIPIFIEFDSLMEGIASRLAL